MAVSIQEVRPAPTIKSGVFEVVSDAVIGGLGDGSPVRASQFFLPMRDGMEFDKEGKVIAMWSNGVIHE